MAFRALNSSSADRTSNELSDGPPGFHSHDEEDSRSREMDKLSSDSDSHSSSSDDKLDSAGDSASISTISSTALSLGDLRMSLAFGIFLQGSATRNPEEFHVEFPLVLFSGWHPAVGIWLRNRDGSIVKEFTPVAKATRTSL